MYNNYQLSSWPNFLHSLQTRFAPLQFDDPQGVPFKLIQTSSFSEYQRQFESLSNRVVGLSHNFLLSCFISGLKPHICCDVQALHLLTLCMQLIWVCYKKTNFQKSTSSKELNQTYSSYQSPSLPPTIPSQSLLPKPTDNILSYHPLNYKIDNKMPTCVSW